MTDETIRPPTPSEIEFAKLMAVRNLIPIIRQNNNLALEEMLYRLTASFKGRLRTGPDDTAEPEEMAQALLTAVLMAGITYTPPAAEPPAPPPGQFAVLDVETHEVITSFATEQEAVDFVNSHPAVRNLGILPVAFKEHDGEAGAIKIDPMLQKFFPGKSGVKT